MIIPMLQFLIAVMLVSNITSCNTWWMFVITGLVAGLNTFFAAVNIEKYLDKNLGR